MPIQLTCTIVLNREIFISSRQFSLLKIGLKKASVEISKIYLIKLPFLIDTYTTVRKVTV